MERLTAAAGLASALTAALLSGTANAASADAQSTIEEVVVTAEKRESTLQKTPIAVTAITREDIQTRGLDDFEKIQFVAPGLVYNEIADTANITIRGIGVDQSTMDAEPGVALYSDGVYRGGLVSSTSLLFDLERIEVLRGPQGTLHGRNSTGGSLNVVSRLPGDEPAFDASLLYGDYDRYRVELSGDAPVQDGFTLRGAFAFDTRDGYADNNFTGREEDDAESIFAKVAAVFTPGDTVDIILRGEYTDTETGGPAFLRTDSHPVPPLLTTIDNPGGILNVPGTFCGPPSCADALGLSLSPGGVGSDDPRELFANQDTQFERDSFGLSATINWDLNDRLQLRSVTAYFELEQQHALDNDGTEIAFLTNDTQQDIEEFTQELTLFGTAGKLDWIGGAYYYESEIDELYSFTLPAQQATFEALFGLFGGGGPLPPGSLAFFGNRIDGSSSAVPFLDNRMVQDLTSYAVYGQGTYNFSDRVRGTLGLRWTKDDKEVKITFLNNLGAAACSGVELDDDWSEVTAKVGLDMDVGDNTLLYGSYSRGYKAGGFNAGDCNNPYDPEIVNAFEIGTKSRLLDNTLQLNLSAFFYDYTDLQARLFVNNAALLENATDAESYGAEIEVQWLATHNFRVDGSVSLLNAEFTDFETTNPLNPQIGFDCDPISGLACLQDLSGNSLLRSPETKVALTAEYDIDLGSSGTLTVRGEYAYTDEVYHTIFNDQFARERGYSITNARLIWSPGAGSMEGVTIMAFVENISDEEYALVRVANATSGGTQSQFGPPRVWGIQLRYSR